MGDWIQTSVVLVSNNISIPSLLANFVFFCQMGLALLYRSRLHPSPEDS